MPIVNFAVPVQLEKKINATIKKQGFASKAEFFRFAAIHYLDHTGQTKPTLSEMNDFDKLTSNISRLVKEKYAGKTLPSAEEQLADI